MNNRKLLRTIDVFGKVSHDDPAAKWETQPLVEKDCNWTILYKKDGSVGVHAILEDRETKGKYYACYYASVDYKGLHERMKSRIPRGDTLYFDIIDKSGIEIFDTCMNAVRTYKERGGI